MDNEKRRIKAKLDLLDSTTLPVWAVLEDYWQFRSKLSMKGLYIKEDVNRLFKKDYLKKLEVKDLKQQKLFE